VDPSTCLVALFLVAIAVVAHLLFWRLRLAAPGREDERLTPTTADGWRLCLGRRRPRGVARRPPVLLVPGIAMNRLALDFGLERQSLSACLAEAGLDCFALDLRGHGLSRPGPGAPRRWSLDDYLALDLPAALDAVREATGEGRVLFVGHSQGALLALAMASLHPERVAGVVALAPPIRLAEVGERLRLLPWLARLGIARLAAHLAAPFSGVWQPARAGLAIQLEQMEPAVYRRMLMNAMENLPIGVVAQFEALAKEDRFGSLDGAVDHLKALSACRQPALFVAAPLDGLAPVKVVREAFERWGGEKDWFAAPEGVGHTDLILGRRAPQEVFPAVREWLIAHSEPARRR
jgi:pimeloyl-ACP methyl ester carboxylesterase